MPNLLGRHELSVSISYGGWALQDQDDTQVAEPFPGGFERGPFLTAREGRLDFTSAGHTHSAELTVEVWDAEPGSPSGEWDEAAEARIYCTSGNLRVWSMDGPMPGRIELSNGPAAWKVRAVSAGRREVAELATRVVPHGVERYRTQFWPE